MTNNEILLMVDVVCSEKDLDREEVFLALEAALATASRKRHLGDIEARVSIDRETGEYDTFRQWRYYSLNRSTLVGKHTPDNTK